MATSFTADIAEAANRFAVVGVENATHGTLRVDHKWENAHKFVFKYDGNRNYIDLYDKK